MPTHKSRRRPQKSVKAKQKRTRKQRGSGEVTSYSPESIRASEFEDLRGLQTYLDNHKQPDGINPLDSVLNERHNNNKNALNMVFLERNQSEYRTFLLVRTTHACRSLYDVNWLIVYELVKYGFDPHYRSDDMKETPFETMQRCYKEKDHKGITREILEGSLNYLLKYEKNRLSPQENNKRKGTILNAFFPQGSSTGSSPIGTPPPSPRA